MYQDPGPIGSVGYSLLDLAAFEELEDGGLEADEKSVEEYREALPEGWSRHLEEPWGRSRCGTLQDD